MFRVWQLLPALLLLLRCTPPPAISPGADVAANYLELYRAQQDTVESISWEGNIGLVTRQVDQLVLPYYLRYDRHTLQLEIFTPFGTTLGELELAGGAPRLVMALPFFPDLAMLLEELQADSVEITAADAYSYFWGIPFVVRRHDPGIRVSFDQSNLLQQVKLDSSDRRMLSYSFRELPGGVLWPRSIRYLDRDELQVTITIKEPRHD